MLASDPNVGTGSDKLSFASSSVAYTVIDATRIRIVNREGANGGNANNFLEV